MADRMVLKTQKWLNSNYSGRTGYGNNIPENGLTGWTTINALLRAFQIELGITSTANNFGPSTISKFNERFPDGIQQQSYEDETEDNIYGIIQGACWCKGYSTNASDITEHFFDGTGSAIKALKADAGCIDSSSTVTLNVMKALLSMDQFKLIAGGAKKIRQIQQILNSKYESYIGLSPCDGYYGRQMNLSMIKVLQAIEGYSVADATGNFGSGTKANLPIVPSNGELNPSVEENSIKLIRYALCCNGYDVDITSGNWDQSLANAIKNFQSDMCLSQVEQCNLDTWMALLLSSGNPNRDSTGCDTRFEMTNSRLNYLKNDGFEIVGRYLTGGDFKELRIGEPSRILASGMKFFPIFQESGADLSYFTDAKGKADAKKAVHYARIHGIPAQNIIYFAVDTDPTGDEITSYILPYFKAISENIGISYIVGVYGTRNVCTQVMDKGYAKTCFVSDMSTGYSGNMGFKMPNNWNFDQFKEFKNLRIGNSDTIDLDKDIYSGRFPVVENVYNSFISYNPYIRSLEDLYLQYKSNMNQECTSRDILLGVTNFFRSFKYADPPWSIVLPGIDNTFVDYVKSNNISLYNNLAEYASTDKKALTDPFGGFIDIGHLAASIEGYLYNSFAPNFWFGWGGDLASLMKRVKANSSPEKYLEEANKLIGQAGTPFNYCDICSDADAIKISRMLENSSSLHPLSDTLNHYFLNEAELRISYYLLDLDNVSLDLGNLKDVIKNKMSNVAENTILKPFLGGIFLSKELQDACYTAFAQYIIDNYPVI